MMIFRVLELVEEEPESTPIRLETDISPHQAGRVVVPAHFAEYHDHYRHNFHVAISLMPNPVGFCEAHESFLFKGLVAFDRIETELPYRRTSHGEYRWGLRRLVVEEVYIFL
jgi:hypothetical protein